MDGQRHLANLSRNALWFVAKGAWHGITDQVPELVSQALAMLISAAGSGGWLGSCRKLASSAHVA
jgi:hypothetical protein